MNRGELALVANNPADTDSWPEGPPAPIDVDGFKVTDSMRRWANEVYPGFDARFSTQQFVRHYRSTAARRRNWPEAWRKWIAEDADKASPRSVRTVTREDAALAKRNASRDVLDQLTEQLRAAGDTE